MLETLALEDQEQKVIYISLINQKEKEIHVSVEDNQEKSRGDRVTSTQKSILTVNLSLSPERFKTGCAIFVFAMTLRLSS